MPLVVEIETCHGAWKRLGELRPGDHQGSLSDNKPDGHREVYVFRCEPDGRSSKLLRSAAGVDSEEGTERTIIPLGNFDIVKVLRTGDTYDLPITTPKGAQTVIRFKHV
ncbi:MAG: hypothetical protein KGH60_03950 [Candidatus Micrarchaeota archaeon]|nr:hypothetical protein [Candidatus Micrarchaeota archaeon]